MTTEKINVRLSKQWIMEFISMMESCYDLEAECNADAVKLLAYFKKRLKAVDMGPASFTDVSGNTWTEMH